MVKSYLKYEHSQSFGVVTSASSNTIWTPDDDNKIVNGRTSGAGRAYTGSNECVLCWDLKKGEQISRWRDKDCAAEVSIIAQSNTDPDLVAVGYSDGSIRLWDAKTATIIVNFNGHRSGVTTLAFDKQGIKLASGAKDTDIIVWDLVTETGLFKLRGHKDQLTGLTFVQTTGKEAKLSNGVPTSIDEDDVVANGVRDSFILSSSKDAVIKIWDTASQHCIETHITQSNGACWALALSPDENGCITAGNDGEIKIWSLDNAGLSRHANHLANEGSQKYLHERGTLDRQTRDRTTGVAYHPTADFFAVHGPEKTIEIWQIRTDTEVQRALSRKRKRRREKANASGQDKVERDEDNLEQNIAEMSDLFVPYNVLRTGGKLRSCSWIGRKSSKSLQLLTASTNNQLEVYDIPVKEKGKKEKSKDAPDYDRIYSIELPGHRTDIRAMSLSSDDKMLATASQGILKIWNVRTQSCLRTLECGYALCCTFLPGDKIVIVGNKNGELELFDIAASSQLEVMQAHEGSIWSLKVHPDGRSLVTGSADKTVKFWNFEIVQEEVLGTRRTTPRLKLVHKRTLKVNDDVLNVCYSPDSRLLAVATLDNTVKVFFTDSLKLFLNLYGHKLPVLGMSIASDNKLIATCSADKNIRLWGLDFGDCHKAIFAHDESIMQIAFVPEPASREDRHILFSVSKDNLVRSWDGDKFERIQSLSGHRGEIWTMAMSRVGDFVITASHDKSIRIWSQTDEQLFLEEERERELEEMYDTTLSRAFEKDQLDEQANGEETDGIINPASKQTTNTLTASEKITEALNISTEDLTVMQEHVAAGNPGVPQRHPILTFKNVTAEAYLLSIFEAIPSSAMHDALLLLSFFSLPLLFKFLSIWIEKQMNTPLTCRVLFFLLKTHHKQIVASRELRTQLEDMRDHLRHSLGDWKNLMGFNMVATKILSRRVGDQRIKTIEDEDETHKNLGGKKRAFVNVT